MKRSEMDKLLAGKLRDFDYIDNKVLVDNFLIDVMMDHGMLPPDYMSPTGCPCGEPECTEQGIVNEWEPEDEKE